MEGNKDSFAPPFAPLNGHNWEEWQQRARFWLLGKDLWDCVSAPPVSAPDGATQAELNTAAAAKRKDQRALCAIVMSCDVSVLPHVQQAACAHEAWQNLVRVHQRETAGAKLHAMRHLFELKLKPGESVKTHIASVLAAFHRLRQHKIEFAEDVMVYILLSSLDKSFENLCLSFEAMPTADLTLHYVSGRLPDEEQRRQKEAAVSVSKSGCAGKECSLQRSREDSSTVQAYAGRRCYRCNSPSHVAQNCTWQETSKTSQLSSHGNQPRRGRGGNQRRARGRGKGFEGGKVFQNLSAAMATVRGGQKSSLSWIIDSGASDNLCPPDGQLQNCKEVAEKKQVNLADGSTRTLSSTGSYFMQCLHAQLNVYVLPGMKSGLLSVPALLRDGFKVCFEGDTCSISKEGVVLVSVKSRSKDGLFVLDGRGQTDRSSPDTAQAQCVNAPVHDRCQHLWHRRMGHVCWKYVSKVPECAHGCKFKSCSKFLDCRACKRAKVKKCSYPRSERVSTRCFELVHMDLTGPMATASLGGSHYALVLVDDHSRMSWLFPLKDKREAASVVKDWVIGIELQFSLKVKSFQSDRGGEFLGSDLRNFFRKKGIKHRLTCPDSPQENGVAERRNRTLGEAADAMLFDANLPQHFWAEAWRIANFCLNRAYNSVVRGTPYFVLYGKKPKVHFFRTFGCEAYVLFP